MRSFFSLRYLYCASMASFCVETFSSILKTRWLGRNVEYFAETPSTQDFLKENFKKYPVGTVVVTDVQKSGKGRGGNQWTSPIGCLMFSFTANVQNGALLPLFQYIITLALVKCIREHNHPGLQDLPVNIKWPNDIYSDQHKISGTLCNSEYLSGEFQVISGIGINVSNKEPSTCLNELLQNAGISGYKFSREQILADFCNQFECMVDQFTKEGFAPFQEDYYKYWLHSNQKVMIYEEGKEIPVWIEGLTQYGYLKAKGVDNVLYELHPDGNSLDFFKGLLRKKLP